MQTGVDPSSALRLRGLRSSGTSVVFEGSSRATPSALDAIDQIEKGESIEYEVIPL